MRYGLLSPALLLAAIAALSAAPVPQDSNARAKGARIEGHTLSSTGGTPLPGTTVRLQAITEVPSGPDPNDAAYTATAGAEGTFVFDGVAAGSYRLYADHPGYVRTFYGSGPSGGRGVELQVAQGQVTRGLDVAMLRQGSISGRVENVNAEPVSDVTVSALMVSWGRVGRYLTPMAFTNSRGDGSFALNPLPPGQYYVLVDQGTPPRVAGAGGQREVLETAVGREWYPNAKDPETALALDVGPGTEMAGINFRVQPGSMFHVRGKVAWDGVDKPKSNFVLALSTTAQDISALLHPRLAIVQRDGTFSFDEVVPGTYTLGPSRILVDVTQQRHIGGALNVKVGEEDVEELTLHLVTIPDMTGRIRIDGELIGSGAAAQQAPGISSPLSTTPGGNSTPASSSTSAISSTSGTGSTSGPGSTSSTGSTSTGKGVPPPPPPGHNGTSSPAKPDPVSPSGGGSDPSTSGATAPSGVGAVVSGSAGQSSGQPSGVANSETATGTPLAASSAGQPALEGSRLSNIAIALRSTRGMMINEPQAASDAEGMFSLKAVPLGAYQVVVNGLPDGTYVKSVLLSGRETRDVELDLASGAGGEFEIILARGAGEVSGTAKDSNDKPLANAMVSIWKPDGPWPKYCGTASTDQAGRYRVSHLDPGTYRVVAWEEIDSGLATVGSFCRMFESAGTKATIEENSSQIVNLKAIPAREIKEATGRMPR